MQHHVPSIAFLLALYHVVRMCMLYLWTVSSFHSW